MMRCVIRVRPYLPESDGKASALDAFRGDSLKMNCFTKGVEAQKWLKGEREVA